MTNPPEPFQRIAVIRLSSVGDVIMAMPAVEGIRATYPDARISWVVEGRARNILEGFPAIDEIIEFPRNRIRELWSRRFGSLGCAREVLRFRRELRSRRFDLSIDFQGNLKSGFCTFMAGARVRIGYEKSQCREPNWLFTNRKLVMGGQDVHRMDRDLLLAGRMGVPFAPRKPRIRFTDEDRGAGDGFIPEKNGRVPVCVLHPGTSDFMPHKRWPVPSFARLGDLLHERTGARIALSWGPGEEPMVESVQARMDAPSELLPPTPTIKSLGYLLSRADLVIGGDTGPIHLAVALGVDVLTILGPGDPRHYYPHGHPERVFYRRMPCAPCRHRGCEQRTCLEDVRPEAVAERAVEILTARDDSDA